MSGKIISEEGAVRALVRAVANQACVDYRRAARAYKRQMALPPEDRNCYTLKYAMRDIEQIEDWVLDGNMSSVGRVRVQPEEAVQMMRLKEGLNEDDDITEDAFNDWYERYGDIAKNRANERVANRRREYHAELVGNTRRKRQSLQG